MFSFSITRISVSTCQQLISKTVAFYVLRIISYLFSSRNFINTENLEDIFIEK